MKGVAHGGICASTGAAYFVAVMHILMTISSVSRTHLIHLIPPALRPLSKQLFTLIAAFSVFLDLTQMLELFLPIITAHPLNTPIPLPLKLVSEGLRPNGNAFVLFHSSESCGLV